MKVVGVAVLFFKAAEACSLDYFKAIGDDATRCVLGYLTPEKIAALTQSVLDSEVCAED
jgi:hypothetical protein